MNLATTASNLVSKIIKIIWHTMAIKSFLDFPSTTIRCIGSLLPTLTSFGITHLLRLSREKRQIFNLITFMFGLKLERNSAKLLIAVRWIKMRKENMKTYKKIFHHFIEFKWEQLLIKFRTKIEHFWSIGNWIWRHHNFLCRTWFE